MTFSKEWLIFICAFSVVSAVIEAIVPKTKTKSAFSFLVSAVLIYSFMLPVINGNLPEFAPEKFISDKTELSDFFEENSSETALMAVEEGYKKVIGQALVEENIFAEKIEVSCESLKDEYVVTKVEIYADLNDSQKLTVKNKIRKICGDSTEIVFSGGEMVD